MGKGKLTICSVPLLHNNSFILFKDLIDNPFNIFQRDLNSYSRQNFNFYDWMYEPTRGRNYKEATEMNIKLCSPEGVRVRDRKRINVLKITENY